MLASGRPVLATAFEGTQIAKVLESSGVIVPPEDIDLFVNALVDLADNAVHREQLSNNARQYAVEFLGRNAILGQFEKFLQECVASGR
jgi:colanic acid biosynthesis glycosyl transferase WcaI